MRTRIAIASFIAGSMISVALLAPPAAAETPCPAPTSSDPAVAAVTTTAPEATPTSTTVSISSATAVTAPTTVVQIARPQVYLNELLPDPTGKDTDGEFIELANIGQSPADIAGWSLNDAEGRTYVLPQATIMGDGFLVLPYATTKLALVNDGATITLKDATGAVVSEATYGAAKEGQSWARGDDGVWSWNKTPTPGATNASLAPAQTGTQPATPVTAPWAATTTDPTSAMVLTNVIAADAPTSSDTLSADSNPTAVADQNTVVAPETPIDAISDQTEGAEVTVSGIVTLPPGVIGTTIFAIQDENGGSGIYVRLSGSTIPDLIAGDEVEIVGRVRKKTSPARISARASDVTKTGRMTLAFAPRDTGEIDVENTGNAIEVQGSVTDRGTHWLIVANDSGDGALRVTFPKSVPTVAIAKGDSVTVRGVVRNTSKGVELVVAQRKNIDVTPTTEAVQAQTPAHAAFAPARRKPIFMASEQAGHGTSSAWIWWAAILAMAAGSVGVAIWRRRKEAGMFDAEQLDAER